MFVGMSEAQRVLEIIRFVWRLPSTPNARHWQTVLEMSQPLVGKTTLEGSKGAGNDMRLLSLMWAVRGDAFRSLGEPRLAADAYGTACDFMPSTGFAGYYSKLVLDHRFEDHYGRALASLDASIESWSKLSLFRKVFGWTAAILHRPVSFFREIWPQVRHRDQWRDELRRRLEGSAPTPA